MSLSGAITNRKGHRCDPCAEFHRGCNGVRPVCDKCQRVRDRGLGGPRANCVWSHNNPPPAQLRRSANTRNPVGPSLLRNVTQAEPSDEDEDPAQDEEDVEEEEEDDPEDDEEDAFEDGEDGDEEGAEEGMTSDHLSALQPVSDSDDAQPSLRSSLLQYSPALQPQNRRQSAPLFDPSYALATSNSAMEDFEDEEIRSERRSLSPKTRSRQAHAMNRAREGRPTLSGGHTRRRSASPLRDDPAPAYRTRSPLGRDFPDPRRRNAIDSTPGTGMGWAGFRVNRTSPDPEAPPFRSTITLAMVLSGNLPEEGAVFPNVDRGLAQYADQDTEHLTVDDTEPLWYHRESTAVVLEDGQVGMAWEYPYQPGRPTLPMSPDEAAPYLFSPIGEYLPGRMPEVDPDIFAEELEEDDDQDPAAVVDPNIFAEELPEDDIQYPAAPSANNQQEEPMDNDGDNGAETAEAGEDDWMDEFVDWDGNANQGA